MRKPKISSKLVDARTLALYELDQFINYVHTVHPELKPNEFTVVAAVVLHNLPRLFQDNPLLIDELAETVATIKRQVSRNAQRSTN